MGMNRLVFTASPSLPWPDFIGPSEAGGGDYEMTINIKSRSAKKSAFNLCL
jgi:hypothetical protein